MNGGAGKKANLDIVGGGEGSVAGGRGHGWGADLANRTERCFDSRGTTAAQHLLGLSGGREGAKPYK